MKKMILIITMVFICSCNKSTPKDILIQKAETELKKTMHDPSSYEFVSFEEDLQKLSDVKIQNTKLGIEPEYQSDVRYYKLIYRGKNMMGALILNETYVVCSNDKDLLFLRLEN